MNETNSSNLIFTLLFQGEKIKKSLVKTGEDFLRNAKETHNHFEGS